MAAEQRAARAAAAARSMAPAARPEAATTAAGQGVRDLARTRAHARRTRACARVRALAEPHVCACACAFVQSARLSAAPAVRVTTRARALQAARRDSAHRRPRGQGGSGELACARKWREAWAAWAAFTRLSCAAVARAQGDAER